VRRGIATTTRLVIAIDPLLVTTGLDPVVHAEWPSAFGPMSVLRSSMDRRVKPGDDEERGQTRW
jgi:hypothetical protein